MDAPGPDGTTSAPDGAGGSRPAVEVWARDGRRTELAPGALDALRLLGPGREIDLIHADGHRDRWRIHHIESGTTPTAVDTIEVDHARGALTLTICGGPYLAEARGYARPVVLRCVPTALHVAA